MRQVIDPQRQFGQVDIADIVFDPKSRDDIPPLLRGLQHLYLEPAVRERVFAILAEVRPERADGEGPARSDPGRPGMPQWTILVLGTLRLGLNADYDRIQELANQHTTLRPMLGHGDWSDATRYALQTLKDNLRLFTPELLDRINQEGVRAGHAVLKKSPDEGFAVRCDSFVVETDVEFPTDTGLLFEAVRKALGLVAELSVAQGLPGWRQHRHHLRQFKKAQRRLRPLRHATAQDERKRQARQTAIEQAHRAYLEQATALLERLHETRTQWLEQRVIPLGLAALDDYVQHAERQIDPIRRRVLLGEVIPPAEQVFSIFEPPTEWSSKGKAGVPVELGLRVCVIEDQYRFILHHQVMEKTTDDQVAVPITTAAKTRFPAVQSIRFDKGFHSPANQTELPALVGQVVLPKKGKLSVTRQAVETDPDFVRLRRRHAAVESAINALESHGLDRCPDHGLDGFKRYVALAVVARNIQRLGAILQEPARRRHRGPYRKTA